MKTKIQSAAKKFFYLSVCIYFFSSCADIYNPYGFVPIAGIEELCGTYPGRLNAPRAEKNPHPWGNYKSLPRLLHIQEENSASIDFVTIEPEGTKKLKLSFYTDSIRKEFVLKGRMRKKAFEIYTPKKRFGIPFVLYKHDYDWAILGKSKEGNLQIISSIDRAFSLLILTISYPTKLRDTLSFDPVNPLLKPTLLQHQWGYTNSSGEWKIPAKYDFACAFERDAARIKINKKWGLINREGAEIIPPKYDWISPVDTLFEARYLVSIAGKKGIINANGKEILPPIYDTIETPAANKLTKIQIEKKQGFMKQDQIIIPAVYSEVSGFKEGYAVARRSEKVYIIDKEGYEYDTSRPSLKGIKRDTKRKIPIDGMK